MTETPDLHALRAQGVPIPPTDHLQLSPGAVAAGSHTVDPRETAAAVRASGATIHLLDGQQVRLRYSMDALDRLEAEFGNIGNVLSHMREAEEALMDSLSVADGSATEEQRARHAERERTGVTRSIFGILRRVILPGLADQQAIHPRTRQPFYLDDDPAAAARLLDVSQLRQYVEAFSAAFSQAFHNPTPTAAVGDAPDPRVAQVTASGVPSPGPTGTTSPQSWGTAPMPSSGA